MPRQNDTTRLNFLLQNSGVRPEIASGLADALAKSRSLEHEFWSERFDSLQASLARLIRWQKISAALLLGLLLLLLAGVVLVVYFRL